MPYRFEAAFGLFRQCQAYIHQDSIIICIFLGNKINYSDNLYGTISTKLIFLQHYLCNKTAIFLREMRDNNRYVVLQITLFSSERKEIGGLSNIVQ